MQEAFAWTIPYLSETMKSHRKTWNIVLLFLNRPLRAVFQRYCDMVDKVPKIINPQDKENYKYLVNRCDQYAKRHYGRISAVVDYGRWDSKINLYLPMLEFTTEEAIAVISEHTGSCAN